MLVLMLEECDMLGMVLGECDMLVLMLEECDMLSFQQVRAQRSCKRTTKRRKFFFASIRLYMNCSSNSGALLCVVQAKSYFTTSKFRNRIFGRFRRALFLFRIFEHNGVTEGAEEVFWYCSYSHHYYIGVITVGCMRAFSDFWTVNEKGRCSNCNRVCGRESCSNNGQ